MTAKRKSRNSRRAEIVALSDSEFFGDDHKFREAYETARYALEAALLIRRMRKKANLTQKQLARRMEVAQPQISKLERTSNLAQGPSYAMLRQVAEACGLTWRSPVAELDQ